MLTALSAAALVFLAELGDKTQLVVLALDARRSVRATLAALAAAIAALEGLSVLVGAGLGELLPERVVGVGAGLLFLAFAVWAWRTGRGDDDGSGGGGAPAPTLTAFVLAFVAAEAGDKSSLTTAALASRGSPLLVWLGATAGMLAVTALALLAGRWLRRRVGERLLVRLGAVAFAVAGLVTLGLALV